MEAAEHLHHLKQDGWSVVEEVIPASDVDAVKQDVLAATRAHQNPDVAKTRQVGHVGGFISFNQAMAPSSRKATSWTQSRRFSARA